MSNNRWEKVENAIEKPADPVAAPPVHTEPEAALPSEPSDATHELVLAAKEPASAGEPETAVDAEDGPVIRSSQYASFKPHKRRYRFAAPLGLLVILLAATGLVSLIVLGVRSVQKAQDDTALREELTYFLTPLAQNMPSAFESVTEDAPDELLMAAIWRITEAERIRQLRENDDVCRFPLDDESRMMIPLKEIKASYAALFGDEAPLVYRTIGGEDGSFFAFSYDAENACYHVPFDTSNSTYQHVIGDIKKQKNTLLVTVGYVPIISIGVDERGNTIAPTIEQAETKQLYTLEVNGESWKIVSISSIK